MTRVLIVDDDAQVRAVTSAFLLREGYDVFEARNGRECFSLLDKEKVDVVIVDMLMPEVDGVETILRLKQGDTHPRIIGISGGGRIHGIEYLHMARKFGADKTILKPFAKHELLQALQSILRSDELA